VHAGVAANTVPRLAETLARERVRRDVPVPIRERPAKDPPCGRCTRRAFTTLGNRLAEAVST
jgi:hypothetical protein